MEMNEFDKEENLSDFTKRCLKNDRVIGGGCYEWFMKCWTESEDYNDFIRCFFSTRDERYICSQAYGQLSKETPGHDERLELMLSKADEVLYTESDAGCLKIGNEQFQTWLPNGLGDGVTEVYIYHLSDKHTFSDDMIKNGSYICGCSGRIGIFFYDCGSVIEEFIEGKYQVYSDDGRVIFVQYD